MMILTKTKTTTRYLFHYQTFFFLFQTLFVIFRGLSTKNVFYMKNSFGLKAVCRGHFKFDIVTTLVLSDLILHKVYKNVSKFDRTIKVF